MDIETWEEVKEAVPLDSDTIEDNAVIQEGKDRSEYPTREYKVLKGFKTWKPKHLFPGIWESDNPLRRLKKECKEDLIDCETGGLGLKFNIERFGIKYGTDPTEIAEFFATISLATDPFVVWHSPIEHNFPNLAMMDREDRGEEVVYRIECRNGESQIYKVTYLRETEDLVASGRTSLASDEGENR